MATIMTVHGTGATGPEEGQAWWQKGAAFEHHIRELVEGDDGKLNFERLIWDGANSEASRRKAAASLLSRMQSREAASESYCLIGHSHGGSVIAHALMLGKQPLPNLSRWITVGTPFISCRQSWLLFSRLGTLGKTAYLAFLTFYSILLLGIGDAAYKDQRMPMGAKLAILFFLFVVPVLIVYIIARRRTSRRVPRSRKLTSMMSNYAARWLPLWHANDEAIRGLESVKRLRFSFFSRDFAVPLFSLASLFAVPGAILFVSVSGSAMSRIFPLLRDYIGNRGGYVQNGELVGGGTNIIINTGAMIEALYGVTKHLGASEAVASSAILLGLPASLFLASLIVTYTTIGVASVLSNGLARILDHLTWRQIRQSAYGADVIGESGLGAGTSPTWLGQGSPALPSALQAEISRVSDAAASRSLSKFRSGLSELALSDDRGTRTEFLTRYLTWEELIHTSYFGVPRFRMLVAYAIATSKGFRPSEAFRSHPDYELVARWYGELRSREPAAHLQASG